jgi:hypothetical protein
MAGVINQNGEERRQAVGAKEMAASLAAGMKSVAAMAA